MKHIKKNIIRLIVSNVIDAIILLISLFLTNLIALWLIPLAEAERGAAGEFGGEWLVIIATFLLSYKGLYSAFYKWLEN